MHKEKQIRNLKLIIETHQLAKHRIPSEPCGLGCGSGLRRIWAADQGFVPPSCDPQAWPALSGGLLQHCSSSTVSFSDTALALPPGKTAAQGLRARTVLCSWPRYRFLALMLSTMVGVQSCAAENGLGVSPETLVPGRLTAGRVVVQMPSGSGCPEPDTRVGA